MVKTGCLGLGNVSVSADFLRVSAENLAVLLETLKVKIRDLYFRSVLFARLCPDCGLPELAMLRDSWCKCRSCGGEFDPTEAFQACPECSSRLSRRVYHYWCEHCRRPVRSIFCFDAKVFDAAYFREMMRECRERKRAKKDEIRRMLAQSRSGPLVPSAEPSLDAVPGLAEALNAFVDMPVDVFALLEARNHPHFDLRRYRKYILDLVSGCTVHFDGISRLVEDARLDRVFRFIAIIFMQHDGDIDIVQDQTGRIILRGK